IARANAHRTSEELADMIFTAVSGHAEGVEAFDDQTIVVMKVKGPSAKKCNLPNHRNAHLRLLIAAIRDFSASPTSNCTRTTFPSPGWRDSTARRSTFTQVRPSAGASSSSTRRLTAVSTPFVTR